MRYFILMLLVASHCSMAQPPRKAIAGILGHPVSEGLMIDSIIITGSFAKLPVKKGDILESVNDHVVKTYAAFASAFGTLRTGDAINIHYLHDGKSIQANGKAIMRPLETSSIADIQYDWVPFRNGQLRAITRKPKGRDRLPVILLIPGYGCGSIENYSTSYNGRIIDEWIKNGFAVVTIEKSGLGDSYDCIPCAEADLATDIESYDAGYKYMERLPFVDTSNLFIWGHSMGGVVAPEVAKRHHPKGVMVFATTFRPWSEFLLEMHRVQKPLLDGLNYQQTESFMRIIQKIYYEFFVLKKSPALLFANSEYRDLVASELDYREGSNDQWGRHWKFWQQIDSLNLSESWKQVNCPVLVLHGGADYEQCSAVEPMLIKETVNAAHPGFATQVTIPDIDHFMMKSNNWKEAVEHFKSQEFLRGNFNQRLATETNTWLNRIKS